MADTIPEVKSKTYSLTFNAATYFASSLLGAAVAVCILYVGYKQLNPVNPTPVEPTKEHPVTFDENPMQVKVGVLVKVVPSKVLTGCKYRLFPIENPNVTWEDFNGTLAFVAKAEGSYQVVVTATVNCELVSPMVLLIQAGKGPQPPPDPVVKVVVPSVVGKNLASAVDLLSSVGLTGTPLGDQTGNVVSQNPVAGTSVAKGSNVILTLATNPNPLPTGFRVIIVHESQAKLTKEQINVLNSTKIVDYLNKKTMKTGNGPGWKKWDKDINVENELEIWKQIWAAVKPQITTLPAAVVIVDTNGQVFDISAMSENEVLNLLEKYGGK